MNVMMPSGFTPQSPLSADGSTTSSCDSCSSCGGGGGGGTCAAGQMCQVPTPQQPNFLCSAPSGATSCPTCGAYDASKFSISYVCTGSTSQGAWSDCAHKTDLTPAIGRPGLTCFTEGTIVVNIQYTGQNPKPQCVKVRLVASSGVMFNNDGWSIATQSICYADNGFGDTPTGQCSYSTPVSGGGLSCDGTHDFPLALDETGAMSISVKMKARIQLGSPPAAIIQASCSLTASILPSS